MILEKISELLPNLSPTNKKIAKYIIKNYSEIGFLSVEELSENSQVSKASIVRFARAIGFSGFDDFKKSIQAEMKKKLSPYDKIVMTDLDTHPWEQQFHKLAVNEIENLKRTLDKIEAKELIEWINEIIKAKSIFVSGFGATRSVANFLEYALNSFLDKPISVITGSISDFSPTLKHIKEGDMLILMTFPPYSKEIEFVAKYSKEHGAGLFLITNSAECPVYNAADSVLLCESNSLLLNNSYVGPIALLQVINNFLMLNRKAEGMEAMKKIWSVEEEGYKFIDRKGDV